jgi:hypothetical protein
VRRQGWRVTARSEDEAFAWRAALRGDLEDELLPAFGRAFDEAAPGEGVVHIPRLELRLRVASPGELGAALSEALSRELRALPPAPPRPAALDWHELLLGYLENGALAWRAAHRDPADAVAQLRAALLVALEPIVRGGSARSEPFARRVQYYFRLLQLLPVERWPEAAKYVAESDRDPSGNRTAVTTEAALAALVGPSSSLPRHVVHRLAAVALAAASDLQAAAPALREELAAALDIRHAGAAPALAARLADVLAALPSAARLAAQLGALPTVAPAAGLAARLGALPVTGRLAALPAPAASFFAARLEALAVEEHRSPGAQLTQQEPAMRSVREQGALVEAEQRSEARAQEPRTFTLAASSAGLVLLHPFLPQLFETCGMYRRPELTSLPRAAALLHWLATGCEEAHEFELGFVKLLLGLRPETPLAVGPGLIEARERDEGEELLRATIGHWKALKGTSIEGLRVSFLQRRGALREEDDGWRLQLESEAFDVLLRHLPWGIGMVKLPWMTRPLYIDWPMP